jgi:putative transcriptional regulator
MADRLPRSTPGDPRDPNPAEAGPEKAIPVMNLTATAQNSGYLANQFLVAMPGLEDDNFNHSVTLLCEHSEKGALGLVINRPMSLHLQEMLDQMGLPREQMRGDPIVYWGGPVQPERGFVVHSAPSGWDSSMPIGDDLYITTSRDILAAIGRGEGPKQYFVALGYAGWGAGQLDEEVLRNSWLNTPVDRSILFHTPVGDRWRAATRLLGVDITHLASVAGHA